MPDTEPARRGSPNPFGAFLEGISRAVDSTSGSPGSALALEIQRVLVERASSEDELAAARKIDRSAVAALIQLGREARPQRIDEIRIPLDLTRREARMAVYCLEENGLADISDTDGPDEAVSLTPRGQAMLDRIPGIVAR